MMIPLKMTPAYHRVFLMAAAVFVISSFYLCTTRLYIRSMADHAAAKTAKEQAAKPKEEIKLNDADLPMSYGGYARPPLGDMIRVGAIPTDFVPSPENGRRLIVVGDIHGMDSALDALLLEARFNDETDHVVSVGDIVNKGLNSPAVVSRLMQLKASAVRGNHEDRVLLSRASLDDMRGVMAEQDSSPHMQHRKGKSEDVAMAHTLNKEQLDWLAARPVILTADPLPLTIVHAGLVPGVALESQDPWAVMNMRTIAYPREELRKKAKEAPRVRDTTETGGVEETGSTPGKRDDGEPSQTTFDRAIIVPLANESGEKWTIGWENYQEQLAEGERRTVIYGHDSKSGFQEGKYTLGLDSGCVNGNSLTAAIIEATSENTFQYKTVQVGCSPP